MCRPWTQQSTQRTTLENQDNVTPVDSSVTFDAATPTVTVTPHSLTTLKIRPRAAGTINAAPVITASDRTITVGDAFDPLDGVTAHDAEDGDMPLAAANVTADDVDPDTPGTITVTIHHHHRSEDAHVQALTGP